MSSDSKLEDELALEVAGIFVDVLGEIQRARHLAQTGRFAYAVSEHGCSDAEAACALVEEGEEVFSEILGFVADGLGLSRQIAQAAIRSNDLGQLLFQAATSRATLEEVETAHRALDTELLQVAATAIAFAARRRIQHRMHAASH